MTVRWMVALLLGQFDQRPANSVGPSVLSFVCCVASINPFLSLFVW